MAYEFFIAKRYFHSKRRTDTEHEDRARLTALLRRFRVKYTTELATKEETAAFLLDRLDVWKIGLDRPETVDLLATKANGNIDFALGALAGAVSDPRRKLTYDLVMRSSADLLID